MKIVNALHCNNVVGVKILSTELQDFHEIQLQEKVKLNIFEIEFVTPKPEQCIVVEINNLQEPRDIYNIWRQSKVNQYYLVGPHLVEVPLLHPGQLLHQGKLQGPLLKPHQEEEAVR